MVAQSEGVGESRRAQAELYVEALAGSKDAICTFQTFPDAGDSSLPPQIIHASLADAWERLLDAQDAGHGVFVMVNAGNGTGRSSANVVGLRALFADDDAGAVRLTQLGLRPSIVVASGHGAHFYWLLTGTECRKLREFTPAQKGIATKLGTDPKVSDLARVMRLPGTDNLKDRSHPVPFELLCARPGDGFTINEILTALGATPSAPAITPAPVPSSEPCVLVSDEQARAEAYVAKIFATEGEGGDAATWRVAAALLKDFALPRDQAWAIMRRWNATNASPPWDEKELGRKFMNAERHGKAPVGKKLAEQMARAIDANAAGAVQVAVEAAPVFDPSLWCVDVSQGGKPWRQWHDGAWQPGISEPAMDRLLRNAARLNKRALETWKEQVPAVLDSAPVYATRERIVNVNGRPTANLYRPPALTPADGNWAPIARVLQNLVGAEGYAGYEWLVGWIAKLTQNVHAGDPRRIGTAPVFTGSKGAGKGVVQEVLMALVGPWNVACVTQSDLNSDFNSFLDGVVLVCADEVFTSDSRAASQVARVKNDLTAHTRTINRKGVAQVQREARENWWFMSNSHRAAEIEKGDRRFTVFRTGGAIPVELGAQVADDARAGGPIVRAFLSHLLKVPATALVSDYRPLATAAKEEMRAASGNSATKFASDVVARGFYSCTGAWARTAMSATVRDLYLTTATGEYRCLDGQSPVILRRVLIDVYRRYASDEIVAPAQQETTLLAALRDEIPTLIEADLLVGGRRERVVAGLPGPWPEDLTPQIAEPEKPLPAQRTLNI